MALDSYNTIMIDCENTIVKEGISGYASPLLPGMVVNLSSTVTGLQPMTFIPFGDESAYTNIGIVVEDPYIGDYMENVSKRESIEIPYSQGQRVYVKFPHAGDTVLARIWGQNPSILINQGDYLYTDSTNLGYLDFGSPVGPVRIAMSRYVIPAGATPPFLAEVVWLGGVEV